MSRTFQRPELHDLATIPQWIQHNARYSAHHPLFVYHSGAELKTITWAKVAQAIDNAAHLVCAHLKPILRRQLGMKTPVIGIFANLDFVTYHTLVWGIVRAGATAFLISTRNSGIALSQLMKKTETQMLFVSADESIQRLIPSALAYSKHSNIFVHKVPSFDDLYSEEHVNKCTEPIPNCSAGCINSPAIILHSSGTTSFPKPVFLSHRIVVQWAKIAVLDIAGMGASQHRMAIHGLPPFHGMGFSVLPWAAWSGLTLAVFPPQIPPILPTVQNLMEGAISCRSTIIFCVPHFVELWSSNADDIERLTRFKAVIYSGGPLNSAIGNDLWRVGVPLVAFYGATELGPVTQMTVDKEWDWVNMSSECDVRYLPQTDQPGLYELVYLETHAHTPAANYELERRRAFATSDLVIRDAKNPLKFKIIGRKDDQIMLSTGEKTNPGPIEVILCRDPLVRLAVMFGRGRSQNGVLIQPAEGHEIDPNDEHALTQYRNDVWLSVEKANAFAPAHSRLFKEMILVTHPSKPMELTAKHAPRRAFVLEAYKSEIDNAYTDVDTSGQLGIPLPSDWDIARVLEYVRATVHSVMNKEVPVNDNDDIFQYGGDSLQATYIRNSILRAVRAKNKDSATRISQSFIYAHPSINSITAQLLNIIRTEKDNDRGDEGETKVREMAKLISKYSVGFPLHRPSVPSKPVSGEVVLITGTTGGLGTQLLSHIASLSEVSHVYALNRGSNGGHFSLREKQAEALMQRGLDASITDLPKVTLVECDTAAQNLGLDPAIFNEIRDSITLIIHNAWRVNFNLALESFAPMIRGVRNLVDLALQSPKTTPPRLIFTGSVGVYRNWTALHKPLEVAIDDPQMALGSGYSESKWIGERILEEAAKCTPLRPVIVRVGQLTSNASGAWNFGDWLPAIVRSGQVLNALPSRNDSIAWISLDIAARAIFEFRESRSRHLHLAHPNPVPWNKVFDVFSSMLNVPLVPWEEWLEKLEGDDGGPKRNPAVHLLEFFRHAPPEDTEKREATGVPQLDLTQALIASSSLADASLPQISRSDAEVWVKYWSRTGFLST